MFKLSADVDLDLEFNKLHQKVDDYQKALEKYLKRPHGDIRQLFNTIFPSAASPPAVLDLGAPGGGLAWSLQQVCVGGGTTLSSTAVANVVAALFVGGVPGPAEMAGPMNFSQITAVPFAVPANYQAGGKSVIARANQHIYLVFSGTGIATQALWAAATVLQIPDTSEALLWL